MDVCSHCTGTVSLTHSLLVVSNNDKNGDILLFLLKVVNMCETDWNSFMILGVFCIFKQKVVYMRMYI
jgi:hypothetical protein